MDKLMSRDTKQKRYRSFMLMPGHDAEFEDHSHSPVVVDVVTCMCYVSVGSLRLSSESTSRRVTHISIKHL